MATFNDTVVQGTPTTMRPATAVFTYRPGRVVFVSLIPPLFIWVDVLLRMYGNI